MEKHEMTLIQALAFILILKSVVGKEITPADKKFIQENEIFPTEAYRDGEVMDPISFREFSPFFHRVKKIELSAPTSSKTETVDISPKLALGDDEDIFWEVTKVPESRLTEGTVRSDYVDGNHPDLFEVITHDHVDKGTGHSGQSKRVKKILPPFETKREDGTREPIGKRNTRNISKPKIIAIKVSDLKGINNFGKKLNKSDVSKLNKNKKKKKKEEDEEEDEEKEEEMNGLNGRTGGTGSTQEPSLAASVEGATTQTPVSPTNAINNSTNFIAGNPSRITSEGLAPAKTSYDIQKPSTSGVSKEDVFSKSFTTGSQTKDVDVAPDWRNSKTTPLADWNSTDLKIRNPEFLLISENTEVELDKMPEATATTTPEEPGKEEEIHGIPLVPNEYGKGRGEHRYRQERQQTTTATTRTTERSIWDFLRERQSTPATTPKPLYKNFDAESAEEEYETENFQHGLSNIEKHEFPFSYAMPWLEVKDKGYDMKKEKKAIHSKINDFPSALPANKKYGDNDAVQIPKDLSKLLKLTENEKSVNGVTVSIVESGTNREDANRNGRHPSKWYLLLLTGNSTIVKLRRKDFTKYLKLNLAARLSVEYDDIKVNKLILAPPEVLVNISVYEPSDDVAEESQFDLKEKLDDKGEAPLYKLAETNATLLELSGEEFHVVRFLSLQSQKPEAEAQKNSVPNAVSFAMRHDDVEFIIYTFIGSACACIVILTLFISFGKYLKKLSDYRWPWKKAKIPNQKPRTSQDEFNGISPAVIYSGGFPQIRGSWMSGVGARSHHPPANPSSAPSILKQYPGIELGMSPSQNRICDSPRHNKLQIYNPGANNLVLPSPPTKKTVNTHPLDVRIGIAN